MRSRCMDPRRYPPRPGGAPTCRFGAAGGAAGVVPAWCRRHGCSLLGTQRSHGRPGVLRAPTVGLMPIPSDSPFDLTGHVALVTGGNGGIGLGMADALAAHGADVAIWGTNPEKNDRALVLPRNRSEEHTSERRSHQRNS